MGLLFSFTMTSIDVAGANDVDHSFLVHSFTLSHIPIYLLNWSSVTRTPTAFIPLEQQIPNHEHTISVSYFREAPHAVSLISISSEEFIMDAACFEIEQLKRQLAEKEAAHTADLRRVITEKDAEIRRVATQKDAYIMFVAIEKDAEAKVEAKYVAAKKDAEITRIASECRRVNSECAELVRKCTMLEDRISYTTRVTMSIIDSIAKMAKDDDLPQEARNCARKLITEATGAASKIDSQADDTLDRKRHSGSGRGCGP